MKKLLIQLFCITLAAVSCKNSKESSTSFNAVNNVMTTDTSSHLEMLSQKNGYKQSTSIVSSLDTFNTNEVFVDYISAEFTLDSGFYTPLYFRDAYTDSVRKSVARTFNYQTNGYQRYHLKNSIVKRHLNIDNLDSVLVIDKDQKIVSIAIFKNYELWEDVLNSYIMIGFNSKKNYSDHFLISANVPRNKISPSEVFTTNQAYTLKLFKQNHFNPDTVLYEGHLLKSENVFSVISFIEWESDQGNSLIEGTYLFKNEVISDTLNRNYLLSSLSAIPLAHRNRNIYCSQLSINETSVVWNGVMEINLEKATIELVERNRLQVNL